MRKKILSLTLISAILMLSACSKPESTDDSVDVITENTTEAADTNSAESVSDSTAEKSADSASTVSVDIKDFDNLATKEYGGNLEQALADALNTTIEDNSDVDQESSLLCDGSIEIFGSANGTGFYVTQYKEVDGFSIYGVHVGMPAEEAVKTLTDQGLKEENEVYSSDISKYYVSFNTEGDIVRDVSYVKIIDR